jgi:hypothetical protein
MTSRAEAHRRRALELLASCRDGCTEAIMLAHGFTIDMLVELVRAGLATATSELVVAGGLRLRSPACASPGGGGGERWRISCRRSTNFLWATEGA